MLKELRSLWHDKVLLVFLVWAFSFGIYDAADEKTVKGLVESDPYWKNGIWTQYQIKEWIQAF